MLLMMASVEEANSGQSLTVRLVNDENPCADIVESAGQFLTEIIDMFAGNCNVVSVAVWGMVAACIAVLRRSMFSISVSLVRSKGIIGLLPVVVHPFSDMLLNLVAPFPAAICKPEGIENAGA